jgi:hypothetical protein
MQPTAARVRMTAAAADASRSVENKRHEKSKDNGGQLRRANVVRRARWFTVRPAERLLCAPFGWSMKEQLGKSIKFKSTQPRTCAPADSRWCIVSAHG